MNEPFNGRVDMSLYGKVRYYVWLGRIRVRVPYKVYDKVHGRVDTEWTRVKK